MVEVSALVSDIKYLKGLSGWNEEKIIPIQSMAAGGSLVPLVSRIGDEKRYSNVTDPSVVMALKYNSFRDTPPSFTEALRHLPESYKYTPGPTDLGEVIPWDAAAVVDVERRGKMVALKDRVFAAIARAGGKINVTDWNPYEAIPHSIFLNRTGVKLAAIDAWYSITGYDYTIIEKQYRQDGGAFSLAGTPAEPMFTFCDLAAAPGGFIDYLMYRRPKSRGYAISHRGGFAWDTQLVTKYGATPDRDVGVTFFPRSKEETGDLYKEADLFISAVLAVDTEGVHLVLADGGIDVTGDEKLQEDRSTRLILTEVYTALSVCRRGGAMVLKIFATTTEVMVQLLYLLARCFERITIFKPCTSRPGNEERYLIAHVRRSEIKRELSLIDAARRIYDEKEPSTIFKGAMPKDFLAWVRENNTVSLNLQISNFQLILKALVGSSTELLITAPSSSELDMDKFALVWSIP